MMKRVLFMEVVVCLAASAVWPAEFDVTRTDDPPPDGCQLADCSLREAVIDANGNGQADTINLSAEAYTLTIPGTNEFQSQTGDLNINENLVILGSGSSSTSIDGSNLDGILTTGGGVQVGIHGVSLQNGSALSGGGISNLGILDTSDLVITSCEAVNSGGAINNHSTGTMTMTNSRVTGNMALGGAGIFNNGIATITDSTIDGNTASFSGGGILNNIVSAQMTIESSTISGNFAETNNLFFGGGGIMNSGSLVVSNSTISGNQATQSDGGGLNVSQAFAYLWNVTFSGNLAASEGGAIYNTGNVFLNNGTLVDNTAADTGGIWSSTVFPDETFVGTTIIAGNSGGNCSGSVTSEFPHYNLESGSSCGFSGPGDQSATDPELGPLADNGGPSLTYMPLAGSPVIDGGDPVNGCLDGLGAPMTTDQRGFPRPVDGGTGSAVCDIGSVEFGSSSPGIFSDGFESGKTSAWSSTVP